MTSRPVTDDFKPFETDHIEAIRLARETARFTRGLTKTRKIRLKGPTKVEKLLQGSGIDQVMSQAILSALKNIK